MPARTVDQLRADLEHYLAEIGAELDLEVADQPCIWAPRGYQWRATTSHCCCAAYERGETTRRGVWVSLLDDARDGVYACDLPDCEQCEPETTT